MSLPSAPTVSVVVVTYEWPEALDVVLEALSEQHNRAFEVIVADDGSGPETQAVVATWLGRIGVRLVHARQEDEGWRVARALNLGALVARGDYPIFMGGDCIPRRGLVSAVRRAALLGWFLASKRLHLSPALSRRVLRERLPVWRRSALRWLAFSPRELLSAPREIARPGLLVPLRDRRRPWRPGLPDFHPPYDAYGFFAGMSRDVFMQVNGYDLRYEGWGHEDVYLAVRLRRLGLRCGWPGPQATMLHLWHPPRKQTGGSNARLLEETKASGRIEARVGLRELAAEVGAQVSANRVGASSSATEPENR